jgi:hypothetical protein
LSTSNKSLDELALENRVQVDDALRGRLIDVPLPQAGMGAFESLCGCRDHHVLAVKMIRLARVTYGVASDEFVWRFTALRARDEKASTAFLTDRIEEYLRVSAKRIFSPGRDMGRVHRKFATIFAAARLAIRFGILLWTNKELLEALISESEAAPSHRSRCATLRIDSAQAAFYFSP